MTRAAGPLRGYHPWRRGSSERSASSARPERLNVMQSRRLRFLMAPIVLVAAAASSVQGQTASRLLEPEDLFRVEEVGDVVWAADGNMAAIVMVRPSRFLDATERRSDIWILSADTKTMSRLTEGAGSDVGFWNPVW